jgi:hypothetical protein
VCAREGLVDSVALLSELRGDLSDLEGVAVPELSDLAVALGQSSEEFVQVIVVFECREGILAALQIPIRRYRNVGRQVGEIALDGPVDAFVYNDAIRDAVCLSATELACEAQADGLRDVFGGIASHTEQTSLKDDRIVGSQQLCVLAILEQVCVLGIPRMTTLVRSHCQRRPILRGERSRRECGQREHLFADYQLVAEDAAGEEPAQFSLPGGFDWFAFRRCDVLKE